MNLIPFLQGKEGMTLYTPLVGSVELVSADSKIIVKDNQGNKLYFTSNGCYLKSFSSASIECLLFPASDQRDWEKYVKKMPGLGETYFYVDILIGRAILLPAVNTGEPEDIARITSGNYFTIMFIGEKFVEEINNKFKENRLI